MGTILENEKSGELMEGFLRNIDVRQEAGFEGEEEEKEEEEEE